MAQRSTPKSGLTSDSKKASKSPKKPAFVTVDDRMDGTSVPLLGGERVEAVYTDITYYCPYSVPNQVKGTLAVTNYKLYFRSSNSVPMVVDVPLGLVSRIEKIGGQRSNSTYGLEIVSKDVRTLTFGLHKAGEGHNRKDIYETLKQHSFPLSFNSSLFAFSFSDRFATDGWGVYDAVSELRRQGLPNESWRISRVNEQYELCDTYPKILGVPKAFSDSELMEVAKFRSRGRIPVLSWMHPMSLATICRCSQPLVGVGNNRSKMDERYIQSIMDANAQSHRIFIMDARPKVNSIANLVSGGGYENEDVYQNAEIVFLDIHNIHVMRESLRKVRDICFPVIDDQKWLSNVESTHWLDHLSSILSGAVRIADKIENAKTSVIVHCSDGWDRTSQLTSLAMLMLDPFFRTLQGFQVLIEKEWCSMGHKFGHRVGHGVDKHNDNDRSPAFLQFIDCVWQMSGQFPCAFEFNEYFLTFLLDHLYTCLFGTFLFNSDKERRTHGVYRNTQSLWSFVNEERDIFLNTAFSEDQEIRAIFPVANVRYMKLWTGYYCRWNPRMRPQEDLARNQSRLIHINHQLDDKLDKLRRELDTKRKALQTPKISDPEVQHASSSAAGNNTSNDIVSKMETFNL